MNETSNGSGFTLKALIAGTFGIALSCSIGIHAFAYLRTGTMAGDWFPPCAGIAFLLMLFAVNPLLRLVSRGLELNRSELIIVFMMIFIAAPLATTGFAAMFLSNLMSPLFYATQSNQWWAKLGQYLPLWLYPAHTDAITWYWEGLPPGESIPWGAWATPIFFWTIAFTAFYALMISMSVIMRKQWVDNERLIFPLMEVPTLLLEDYEKGRRLPPVMRTSMFWIGFGFATVVFGSQILNGINPTIPALRIMGRSILTLRFNETWPPLILHLLPVVVAFGFLIKRDVLLSVWVFGLVAYFQRGVMMSLGVSSGARIQYEGPGTPAIAWQTFGALVVFVLVGLFMGRNHLKSVWRKILTDTPEVDDSDELMSYRKAGLVFALSFMTLFVFFMKMGMTPAVALTVIIATIIVYIAVTRFVIEGGLVLCRPTVPVAAIPIALFGAKGMPIESLAAVTASPVVLNNDVKTGFMPNFMNLLKLTENERLRKGVIMKVTIYSLIVGSIFCLLFTMIFCYSLGGANAAGFNLVRGGNLFFKSMVSTLSNVAETDSIRLTWAGVGAALMCVLTFGRYNFAWWPLHPIGLATGASWGVQMGLLSIFVAWAAKTIVLRIGGVTLFNKVKPFFIGLLVGHLTAMGVSYVCDIFKGPPGLNLYI